MQSQHTPLDIPPAASAQLQGEENRPPRDPAGRTLDEARQEDTSYRADYLARARGRVARLNRMEVGTGLAAAGIGALLLIASVAAGICLDPIRFPGWSMDQRMATFYWLVGGSISASLLGVAGTGVWMWLQDAMRGYNREIGIELDEEPSPFAVDERSPGSGAFLGCKGCGASIPVQAPACRQCGTVPPAPKPVGSRTRPTTTLPGKMLRTFMDGVRGPLDALGLLMLIVVILATVLYRLI